MTREDRAYDFVDKVIDNVGANIHSKRMVKRSKLANKELKKGNFEKAEKLRRKSEASKNSALEKARYNKNKLIDIHLKHQDGEEIRHDNKLRSISKIN
jgi:hypothetical protein